MRINLLQIEMDGNDAGAIVRGLTEAIQGGQSRPAAEPVAAAVAALPAPGRNGKRTARMHRLKPAPRRAKAEDITKPLTISEALRMAVRNGPKTNEEVRDYLSARGVDASSSTVSTLLCQMRSRNEIYKRDSDMRWCKAERPE